MKVPFFKTFLILFCLLFVAFLFTTSFFVRPCSDDLYFYSEFQDKGWFNSIWNLQTNIRFTGFLVFNTIAFFTHNFETFSSWLFIYFLLTFSFGISSSTYFFKFISKQIINQKNLLFVPIISILFVSSFYFSGINAQEIWFWTIANTIYFLPIAILFLAIPLAQNKKIFYRLIFYSLIILLGGMVENLVLSLIACLIFTFFYFKNSNGLKLKIASSIICLMIFPIISLLKSSISNRVLMEKYYIKENGYFNSIFSDYDVKLNFERILFLIAIYLLVMAFSSTFKDKITLPKFNLKKAIIFNSILLCIVFFCTFLPMVYVFGNFGPARSSMPFVFAVNISIFFWCFIVGQQINFNKLTSISIAGISLACMLVFFIKQIRLTSHFAEKYDERIQLIKNEKNSNKKHLLLPPLPDSGVIPSQELNKVGESPNMTSYYFGRLLGAEKDVYLRKD
ncbi:MAG: hypothetical protein ACOVQG_04935 [Crocinitomicaceae bacterium]